MIIIASMMKMARKGFNIYNSCHGHNWHNGHNGFNTSYCPKTPSNAYSDDHNECDGLIIYECCNLSYIMNNYYINMVIMAGLAISAVMAALTVYGRYGLNDFNYSFSLEALLAALPLMTLIAVIAVMAKIAVIAQMAQMAVMALIQCLQLKIRTKNVQNQTKNGPNFHEKTDQKQT